MWSLLPRGAPAAGRLGSVFASGLTGYPPGAAAGTAPSTLRWVWRAPGGGGGSPRSTLDGPPLRPLGVGGCGLSTAATLSPQRPLIYRSVYQGGVGFPRPPLLSPFFLAVSPGSCALARWRRLPPPSGPPASRVLPVSPPLGFPRCPPPSPRCGPGPARASPRVPGSPGWRSTLSVAVLLAVRRHRHREGGWGWRAGREHTTRVLTAGRGGRAVRRSISPSWEGGNLEV